jgi:signal transduction histidine kinase/DNA-binding response OmpR family regulator
MRRLTERLSDTPLTDLSMSAAIDRLTLDFQRALQELQEERARTQQLLREVDRQNREIDRLRSSVNQESNSRLLAEEALDETRDRLQLAVTAAGLALWDWQLPSDQIFLSARWGEMLGDIGQDDYWDTASLRERTHPDDLARIQSVAQPLLTGEKSHAVAQFRVRTAQGWLWIESHAMVAGRDREGRTVRLMGTHADISERKRIEREGLKAREMAEQASRAKGEFLANISHEVRTPLNALMGLNRLLMESPLNPEQRSWLDLMDSSAHALLGLLNDVLDLSRIEAGKLDIEKVPYRLRDTLEELSSLYADQAKAKSIEWRLHLAAELPDLVEGDPGRLRQVLANLLSNALKFTPSGGRIEVYAETITDHEAAPQLQLRVRDSGVGIAKSHQATIFDAFTQADASTARRFGGSGLGLAICARLVNLMGGHMALQSELGQGSTFTATLPLNEHTPVDETHQRAPEAPLETANANGRFAGITVLVAEDHPVNELLINQFLTRLGCQIRNARNGAEAVEAWKKGGVDLILMDVQMPGTNGLEATRLIRAREAVQGSRRTPIIAVTANAMKGDREACLNAGMDGYTPKPIRQHNLIHAMIDALGPSLGNPSAAPLPATPEAQDRNPTGPLALEKLLGQLDGDQATLHQLALAMRSDLAMRLRQLEEALQSKDHDLAIAHAHGLKGSLGSMTAERGARLAKGLELAAIGRDWDLFERALPLLRAEAVDIDTALAALLSEPPARDG